MKLFKLRFINSLKLAFLSRFICLLSLIIFTSALSEALDRGVEVYLIADSVENDDQNSLVHKLKKRGANVIFWFFK